MLSNISLTGSVAEFVAQESTYVPDLNDGVRVNIAPLQKAGLLATGVIAKDETIAGLYLSLALAVLMRRANSSAGIPSISRLSFDANSEWKLELLSQWLPSVRGIKILDTSFPKLVISNLDRIKEVSLNAVCLKN